MSSLPEYRLSDLLAPVSLERFRAEIEVPEADLREAVEAALTAGALKPLDAS